MNTAMVWISRDALLLLGTAAATLREIVAEEGGDMDGAEDWELLPAAIAEARRVLGLSEDES